MSYTTGELAKLCGVTVRTVQFYDNQGLLKPEALSEGGRRLYGEAGLKALQIICMYKSLGLNLSEIKSILSNEGDCREVLIKLLTDRERILEGELAEKRRVIEAVYKNALEALVALDKKTALALADRLLSGFAEDGDEIVFAANYKYPAEVLKLDVVKEKKLKASNDKASVEGGFVLKGKNSDKDVSYGALLQLDREERQAEIAATIFKG